MSLNAEGGSRNAEGGSLELDVLSLSHLVI
jgi:hypothetical protein